MPYSVTVINSDANRNERKLVQNSLQKENSPKSEIGQPTCGALERRIRSLFEADYEEPATVIWESDCSFAIIAR